MIFRQVIHDDLGCASYLVGDESAGVAAVVDPRYEIGEYLRLSAYMGVKIEHVLETHNHADHVSGHGRLAAATGAKIHIHRLAAPNYDHEPFENGFELRLGEVVMRAIHVPGHRPEHTAFALIDTKRGKQPWAILTGDSLFVGDIARPDLAIEKRAGASEIFRSLHERLLTLPGECEIWPGHLGGSMCGGPGMDMKVSSTIAYERAHNALLSIGDEQEFVTATTSGLGPQPPNFEAIVSLNRGPLLTDEVHVPSLTATEVESLRESGALLVDVRPDIQYDSAHIRGAVSNPAVRAGFGTKLGWVFEPEVPLVLVGGGDEDAIRAGHLAASVGIRHIAGHLSGGMGSWREERRPVTSMARIDVWGLHERIGEIQVLDVRERDEWEEGHIKGSVHVPYHDIRGVPEGVDRRGPIAVICSSGQRAGIAGSLLLRDGASEVIHVVDGGVGTWAGNGWPLAQAESARAERPQWR